METLFIEIVTAEKSEKSSFTIDQYEQFLHDATHRETSVVTVSKNLEITSNFLSDSNEKELLLPSTTVIDNAGCLDPTELSGKLTATAEAVVYASTNTAEESRSISNSGFESENKNKSNEIFNSQEDDMLYFGVSSPEKGLQRNTAEKDGAALKSLNESDSVASDFKKTAPQHEDIPSFSEWTQKQLAEAEKKRNDENGTAEKFTKSRGKFRNKNYASPDCGAKIVASNPESLSSSSVLSSLKDEYMLNYCTNRIWFIVELCEAIQAKQLDLANFELFSSSPKHFSVSVSHRFPTRDWSNVGKFTAQDSRDVQTFNLYPHLFGKFVKVEMHSHYGREQFCPISWVGIYGTSEFEVLAKEDERNLLAEDDDGDSYDEDIFLGHKRDTNSPKNLFSSATDAVLSIVKKATAPFMKSESNETDSKTCPDEFDLRNKSCFSPRHIVVCNNCSQHFYDEVFNHLSCEFTNLEKLVTISFVKHSLVHGENCIKLGLDFSDAIKGAPFPSNFLRTSEQGVKYLSAIFKKTFVAALCNVLAVSENKVVTNSTVDSQGFQGLKNLTQKEPCDEVENGRPGSTVYSFLSSSPATATHCIGDCQNSLSDISQSSSVSVTSDCVSSPFVEFHATTTVVSDIANLGERNSEKIKPTKTLTEDEVKILQSSVDAHVETDRTASVDEKATELPQRGHVTSTAVPSLPTEEVNESSASLPRKEGKENSVWQNRIGEIEKEVVSDSSSGGSNGNTVINQDSSLESIISDLNAIERVVNSPANTFTTSNLPADSIFLRLANRIKNLEINMSLSSTYLEELSRRYRIQLELISKSLNLTIQKVEEHSKLEEEKERRREKEILLIRMQLANLTRHVSSFLREQNSWRPQASYVSQHIFFISVEFILIWIVFNYWKKTGESALDRSESAKRLSRKYKRRRNSLEGVKGHEVPRLKMRRPSDEALDIALSRSYKGDALKLDKKRKRRKKDSKCSLNGVHARRKPSEAEIEGTSPGPLDALEKFTCENSDGTNSEVVSHGISLPPKETIPVVSGGKGLPLHDFSGPMNEKSLQEITSLTFVKTALDARNSRLRLTLDKTFSREFNSDQDQDSLKKLTAQKERKGSSSLKKYMKKFF
ncbi:hypothetical protein RUM43_014868 [Polyplax serrata]|uniref:SUN domain-containing protein n=1 Tax=Polyplax serrata TaxID=468196 RepID=A0AAN8NPZ4_POLSC